jgi:hypothetical protein
MTIKMLRANLSELTHVRLTCRTCATAIELEISKITRQTVAGKCPGCQTELAVGGGSVPALLELMMAHQHLKSMQNCFDIEFPIPSDEKSSV